MAAFRVLLGTLHYMGLYMQLGVSTRQPARGQLENHVSGNAMFTEVPHDMTAQRGQDVEMACSFRGAGMPSYSLEIQWWYIRNHLDWTDGQPWTTNEVAPEEETPKDATKISDSVKGSHEVVGITPIKSQYVINVIERNNGISVLVVKVVGSNISHKLRLSRVKPSDEGTYECRVIDFSDDASTRHHRVRAYLQVVPEGAVANGNRDDNFEGLDDTKGGVAFVGGDDAESRGGTKEQAHGHHQSHGHHQEHARRPASPAHHGHSHGGGGGQQQKAGRELRKRDADSNHSHNDCTNEPSCAP